MQNAMKLKVKPGEKMDQFESCSFFLKISFSGTADLDPVQVGDVFF